MWIQHTHFSFDDCENMCSLSYCHHQNGSMIHLPLFRLRSWNNGVRCMFYLYHYYKGVAAMLLLCCDNLMSVTRLSCDACFVDYTYYSDVITWYRRSYHFGLLCYNLLIYYKITGTVFSITTRTICMYIFYLRKTSMCLKCQLSAQHT